MNKLIELSASMARYRGANPLQELTSRLQDAAGCDAVMLLEQTDAFTVECRFCNGGDEMLRSICRPDSIRDAIEKFERVFHSGYSHAIDADPILKGWGTQSLMILPVWREAASEQGGALLLLWRTPFEISQEDLIGLDSIWALSQALFPQTRALRELEATREQLSAILETIPQGVAFIDHDGERGWVNRHAADLLQLNAGVLDPAQLSLAMNDLRQRASDQTVEPLEHSSDAANTGTKEWQWELQQPWQVLKIVSRTTRMRNIEGRIWVFSDVTAQIATDKALAESQRFSERILSTTPNIIYFYDLDQNRNLYTSGRTGACLGFSTTDIQNMGDIFGHLCHPSDLPKLRAHHSLWTAAPDGETREIECRLRGADGAWRWLLMRESAFRRTETGEVTQVLGVAADMTKRITIEAEVRDQEQRWQLALDGTNDGIWDWNAVTGEVYYSGRWKEMLGYRRDELPNRATVWEELVYPGDLARVKAQLDDHLAGHSESYIAEYRIRCRDGHYKWVLARGKAIWDETGRPLRMVGSHADITERKEAEVELSHRAAHDVLTGLPNRRQFMLSLQAQLSPEQRNTFTLCICDIDYFKQVNDTHGHMRGDEVLIAFGRVVKEGIRRSDIVGRMGGDEFYILFCDTTIAAAASILERIRQRFAAISFTSDDGAKFQVTTTFGAAEVNAGMNSTNLIEAADKALYKAKQRGRNCVEPGERAELLQADLSVSQDVAAVGIAI